jgi:hypothetical protein
MDGLDLFICFSLDMTFATIIYGFHDKDKFKKIIQKNLIYIFSSTLKFNPNSICKMHWER